jgi:hypothetical protein
MCFIASIIKIKEDNLTANSIAREIFDEQNMNDDGSASYCFRKKDSDFYYERKKIEDFDKILKNINKYDVCNYHFRNGTGGELGKHNIHFWNMGDWIFAHNGTVPSYQNGKDCDSLGMFKTMYKNGLFGDNGEIDLDGIKDFVNASTFWGRLLVINKKTKDIYYIGDWKAYLVNRSYVVIASSICSFDSKETVNALGITFETDNDIEIETLESEIEGMIVYKPNKGFGQIAPKFKEATYSKGNNNNNWQKDWKDEDIEEEINKELAITESFNEDDGDLDPKYFEEKEKIEKEYRTVIDKIGYNYNDENVRRIEQAEIDKELAIADLRDRYSVKRINLKLPIPAK